MANLKNKKTNAAKKPAAASVQSAQPAAASKDAAKAAEPKVTEVKAAPKKEEAAGAKAAEAKAAPKKEETAGTKAAEAATEARKPADRKNAAKKSAPKKPGRRAAKKTETIQEVFFEYAGEQILTEELVNRIKETYKSEGHRVGAIKSLRVYINPEDRKAYYVINDKAEGKYVEF